MWIGPSRSSCFLSAKSTARSSSIATRSASNLDHDTRTDEMHVVQLTPRGSGCSIVFGDLPAQREMPAGSMRGLQLVVSDAPAARQELVDRGVEVSEIMQFSRRMAARSSASPILTATPGRCRS